MAKWQWLVVSGSKYHQSFGIYPSLVSILAWVYINAIILYQRNVLHVATNVKKGQSVETELEQKSEETPKNWFQRLLQAIKNFFAKRWDTILTAGGTALALDVITSGLAAILGAGVAVAMLG